MHGNRARSGAVHLRVRRRQAGLAFRAGASGPSLASCRGVRRLSTLLVLAAASTGCTVAPPEPPSPPAPARAEPVDRVAPAALDGRETFALAGRGAARWVSVVETPRATLAVADDGTLVDLGSAGQRPLAHDVLPEVRASLDGRVVAWSVRTADAIADVHVQIDGATRRLTRGQGAVVVAVSPDGRDVAFLASSGGLPALFRVAVSGGPPRQLTNVDLPPARGRAPEGFVPPPMRATDVAWVGDTIAWGAADGAWRIDARTGEVRRRP